MTTPIDIRADHLRIVRDVLRRHLPDGVKVWVFGSRATWATKDSSDLDLALEGDGEIPVRSITALESAFEDSDLPYTVDIVDVRRIGKRFRRLVETGRLPLPMVTREGTLGPPAGRDVEGMPSENSGRPSGWRDATLRDLIEIRHGFAFGGRFIHDKPDGNILLTPGNFAIGGGFKGGKFKYYSGSVPGDFVLSKGDLIVTMTDLSKAADTLGYPAFVPAEVEGKCYLHNQRLGRVELRSQEIDARFLFYLMCSSDYRHEVLASATGTTVKHTSPDRILRFRLQLPPLEEQRAIAHILGALDDKIDLNRRMNATLEATARALFRSWFVDFDPVRAKMEGRDTGLPKRIADLFPDRLVGSELGEIPEGWTVGHVEDGFEIVMGQSPPGHTYNDTGDGLPFFQGRSDFGFRYPKNRRFCTAPNRMAQPWDTIVSVRAPVGDINMAWERCCIGRGVAALRPRSRAVSYGYCATQTLQAHMREYEHTGTVFGAINRKQLARLPLQQPAPDVIRGFEDLVHPWDQTIRLRTAEVATLTALRDALLPKLVSGELRVRDAERLVGAIT